MKNHFIKNSVWLTRSKETPSVQQPNNISVNTYSYYVFEAENVNQEVI